MTLSSTDLNGLEVLVATPPKGVAKRANPLVFIHGAYTGAWCWEESFLPYFARLGYACHAPSLAGHGGSGERNRLPHYSLDDYVENVFAVTRQLDAAPILIGHSMGGMVAQKYLEKEAAAAVLLLCSVPPQGLLGSAMGLAWSKPGLLVDLNRMMNGVRPDIESIRQALFWQPIDPVRLQRYAALAQPESHRAIWDMTFFNLPRRSQMKEVPMRVMGAQNDMLIPPPLVRMTADTYGVEAHILPDAGHGLMLEPGWQKAADEIAGWLDTLALD